MTGVHVSRSVVELPPPLGMWAGGDVKTSGFTAFLERRGGVLELVFMDARTDPRFLRASDRIARMYTVRVRPDGGAIVVSDGATIWAVDPRGDPRWSRAQADVGALAYCGDLVVAATFDGGSGPCRVVAYDEDGAVRGETAVPMAYDVVAAAAQADVFVAAPPLLQAWWTPETGARRDVPAVGGAVVAASATHRGLVVLGATGGAADDEGTWPLRVVRVDDRGPVVLGDVRLPLPLVDAGGGSFASLVDGATQRSWEVFAVAVDEVGANA